MRQRDRIGIHGKFILSLLLVGLLPGVVALYATYILTKNTIDNTIGPKFQALAKETAKQVDVFLRREVKDVLTLSISPQIIEGAKKGVPLPSTLAYLKSVQHYRGEEYQRIVLTDPFGNVLADTLPGSTVSHPSFKIQNERKPFISDLYQREEDGKYMDLLDISVPVLNEMQRYLGTLRVSVKFQEVVDSILKVKLEQEGGLGHAMLLSSDGTPLVCPVLPRKEHSLNHPLMTMIMRDPKGWGLVADDGHNSGQKASPSIIGFSPVSTTFEGSSFLFGGPNWYTLIRQDPKDTYSPLYDLLKKVGLIGLAIVSLLSVLGLYVSQTIVRPIQKLQRLIHSTIIGQNNSPDQTKSVLEALEQIKAGPEIRELAQAFALKIQTEQEYQRRLILAEKLAAIGQMAARVAHKNRNHLSAILGAATFLKSQIQETDISNETFELMFDEIHKMDRYISGLLPLDRNADMNKYPTALEPLVEGVLRLLELQGRLGKVPVKREFPENVPIVLVDPDQVHEILVNLLTNSLDAMPEGGTLLVRIVNHQQDVKGIALSISDTGPGISPEDQKHLFDPFFTTKETGTGLGLVICKTIIERHGGKILVDSQPGIGTTITLLFPYEAEGGQGK